MPDLRFEIDRRQLRGLALYGAALGAGGLALTAVWWFGARAGLLGTWAVALDLSGVIALYAWLAFRRAFSEFTPAGIRTRALTWTRTVPWDQVQAVVVDPFRRTVTVTVLRRGGGRVTLGAPVHGGVMSDPDFDRKLRQIQDYVDRIDSADPDRAERLVGPEVGPTAGDLGRPPLPVRMQAAVRWVLLPALAAGALLFVGATLPSEIQAVRGAGTPGSFLVYELPCRAPQKAGEAPRCSVVGAFASDDGRVVRERETLRGAPDGLRLGDGVRAQWVRVISSGVYADPYTTPWYVEAVVGVLCLLGLGWWGWMLRARRRRRAQLRRIQDLPGTGADRSR